MRLASIVVLLALAGVALFAVPTDALRIQSSSVRLTRAVEIESKGCLNVTAWHTAFLKQPPEPRVFKQTPFLEPGGKYSQGNQDSILASLFDQANLGTTDKFFVEFGFRGLKKANSARMELDWHWDGLRMDGGWENQTFKLHKEWITPENVASLFKKYNVPQRADYVSIDIDSCDLWIFLALIKGQYRPRVLTVEYNPNYELEESKTNRCRDAKGVAYQWSRNDVVYGASLMALHKAAESVGYTMVATTKKRDVFLVDKSLICPGTELNVEAFRSSTGLPTFAPSTPEQRARWVMDYTPGAVCCEARG